jgi:flagellar biosynthetic protein FliR
MIITTAELSAWIGSWLWPLFRIGAALGAVPLIGARFVPMRVRLALALALTLAIAPLLPAVPAIEPLSAEGVAVTANQLLIGVAMGFTLTLVFQTFVHGAQIVAMQMGLGFASLIDPQNGVEVPVLSQFYAVLVVLLFLGFDGHLALVEMLTDSFRSMPVAASGLGSAALWDLLNAAGAMFAGAVRVALPAIAALTLVNLAFGVMSRAAPQLNILAVGFPLTLLLGFAVVLFTLPAVVPQLSEQLAHGFDLMRRLVNGE